MRLVDVGVIALRSVSLQTKGVFTFVLKRFLLLLPFLKTFDETKRRTVHESVKALKLGLHSQLFSLTPLMGYPLIGPFNTVESFLSAHIRPAFVIDDQKLWFLFSFLFFLVYIFLLSASSCFLD